MDRRVGDAVGLVEDLQNAAAIAPQLLQYRIDGLDLIDDPLVRGVGDVDEKVGVDGFFERRPETGDEVVGQVANKAHRVAQKHGHAGSDLPAAGFRLQRREQLIGDKRVRLREVVHQCRLARVGVAHQPDAEFVLPRAHFAQFAGINGPEFALQEAHAFLHDATVGFDLALARASRADPAAVAVEVRPHARQSRVGIFQLGEFHLQPRLGGAGVLGENVQNQLTAVEDLAEDHLFQRADLPRGQVVVEQHDVDFVLLNALGDLFRLARPDVHAHVGHLTLGDHFVDHHRARGLRQRTKLAERIVRVSLAVGQNHAHQQGPFLFDR